MGQTSQNHKSKIINQKIQNHKSGNERWNLQHIKSKISH